MSVCFRCDGFNGNGLCDASELQGWTIPNTENCDAEAIFYDGSCTFAPFVSCGVAEEFSYDARETVSIGGQCWFADDLRAME